MFILFIRNEDEKRSWPVEEEGMESLIGFEMKWKRVGWLDWEEEKGSGKWDGRVYREWAVYSIHNNSEGWN